MGKLSQSLPSTHVRYIEIGENQAGQRIDNYLFNKLKGIPKSHIYRIIRNGEVRINKKRVKPAYRIEEGDSLRVPPLKESRPNKASRMAPKNVLTRLEAAILLEDNELIVLNKPSGLAVHAGSENPYGVIEALRQSRPDSDMLELVHRLDRDTSGCLMIAKSRRVLTKLHKLLQRGKVSKQYLTLVAGHWRGGVKVVTTGITRISPNEQTRKVTVAVEGKPAETIFKPLKHFPHCSLLEVELRTGRTHQIRAHAAHIGYPVVGDDKYGDFEFNRKMSAFEVKRLFLHAYRLRFQLPSLGKCYDVTASLDPTLRRVLLLLEQNER